MVFEFGCEIDAPRRARRAFGLLSYSHTGIAGDAMLTASELVSNVVQHTGSGGVLRAWGPLPDGTLRIEVEDHVRPAPVANAGDSPQGGRGLEILASLASAWGVTATDSGKIVWVELSGRSDQSDSDS